MVLKFLLNLLKIFLNLKKLVYYSIKSVFIQSSIWIGVPKFVLLNHFSEVKSQFNIIIQIRRQQITAFGLSSVFAYSLVAHLVKHFINLTGELGLKSLLLVIKIIFHVSVVRTKTFVYIFLSDTYKAFDAFHRSLFVFIDDFFDSSIKHIVGQFFCCGNIHFWFTLILLILNFLPGVGNLLKETWFSRKLKMKTQKYQ